MKIVQSFWSKPFIKDEISMHSRKLGGYIDKKFFYFSLTLSCLQLRKFYNQLELVTDDHGYELIIEKLNLPYTETLVSLNKLSNEDEKLWALGKLKAYETQKKPFIHVDNDVFIWKKFSTEIEKAELVAQNIEINFDVFKQPLDIIYKNFNFLPYFMKKKEQNLFMYNAGIFGGNNYTFFKGYVDHAEEFIKKNKSHFSKLNLGLFNCFFEQYLFARLAHYKNIEVKCLFEKMDSNYRGLAKFNGIHNDTDYIHLLGFYKKHYSVLEKLESTLRINHPSYYYKIIELLKKGII